MIELEVKDYCQNCPEFEADVEKHEDIRFYDNPCSFDHNTEVIKRTNTIVRCKHAERCEEIKGYLKKETEKND